MFGGQFVTIDHHSTVERGDDAVVDVWIVDLDAWILTHNVGGSAPSRELTSAARRRDPNGGKRLLARRDVTRRVLGVELGVPFEEVALTRSCPRCGSVAHGRPRIEGSQMRFSVSSSRGVAAVAVVRPTNCCDSSGMDVGIDIEVSASIADCPSSVLSGSEAAAINAIDVAARSTAFLRLWTAKEAVLKVAGRTIADDTSTVDAIQLLNDSGGQVQFGGLDWRVQRVDMPSVGGAPVVVTVATGGEAPVVVRRVVDEIGG